MKAEEIALLARRGIAFDSAIAARAHVFDNDMVAAIRADYTIALDAQPGLVTSASAGVPWWMTNVVDPEVTRVILQPARSEEIYGSVQKGNWLTTSIQFPVVESTGNVTAYGDFSEGGSTGVNANLVPRESFHYQTFGVWGEKMIEQYGLANLDYAAEVNIATGITLNRFRNTVNFYGIAGMQLYGVLNAPGLSASILPATKTAGGTTWAVATPEEIHNDVVRLFTRLQTQMVGYELTEAAQLVLVMSHNVKPQMQRANSFNVKALASVKETYPNMRIETAPEMATAGGELLQMFVEEVDGQRTVITAFTEKNRSHAVVIGSSSYRQKKSAGTWGTVIRRPVAVATMLGV